MNISSETFTTDGSNSSEINVTGLAKITVDIISVLLGLPINSYVICLIVTGTGNGLAAEFFNLNLVVCEIVICMQFFSAIFSNECKILWKAIYFLDGLPMTSRPLFQCLICVERYLAVVHPVTFLKYKPLRYRVICCVIVWVAGFFSCGINLMISLFFFSKLYLSFLSAQFLLYLSIQLFCCLAVLRALKQSGPGERVRERYEENHMKRRAFYLILITTVSMFVLYTPSISLVFPQWISADKADTLTSIGFICLTLAGLVQPFLFLYRVGKLKWQ